MIKVYATIKHQDNQPCFSLDRSRMVEVNSFHPWYVERDEVYRAMRTKPRKVDILFNANHNGSVDHIVTANYPIKFHADGSISVGHHDCHTFPASQVAIIRKWAFGKKRAKKKGSRAR